MQTKYRYLSVAVALACQPVWADEINAELQAVEHIVVTSDFAVRNLQNVPASISVVGQNEIIARQAQHLEQILNVAPNVNFASGASRGRFVQIRGIGERSQFAEPINPSVGFVIDDMDFSGIAAVGTLFDVQQVEVLKGPQATEFGAAALAGVVKIQTVEAGNDSPSRVSLSLAENNSWSAGFAHGGELSDKLLYRVAAQQYQSNGFIENQYLGRDDTANRDELTSRLKLKYLASDNLTLALNYQYFDIDNGYDAFTQTNDGKTRSDQPGYDRQQTHALSLKADWRLDWATLSAIGSWSDSKMQYGYDDDWLYDGYPGGYTAFDAYARERDTHSLELRLASSATSKWFNDSTEWVVGAYSKKVDEVLTREYDYLDGIFRSEYQPDNQALYGQTISQLNDKTRLTVGLRYDHFDIDYLDSDGFVANVSDDMLGGKLVLDHQVNQQTMVYAGISRGYKAGGFNVDDQVSSARRNYAPEYNWNYELGVKGANAEGDLTLRVAGFYMQRKDTQVSDYELVASSGQAADFIDIIANADIGTNYGLEVESRWQVNNSLGLYANLGWLRASFKEYTNAKGEFVDKRDQAQSPRYTFNVGMDWQLADDWHWHVEADGKDGFYFSDGHNQQAHSEVLVHSRLSWQLGNWSLSLWGQNLFDREYHVRGFYFNNEPEDGYDQNKSKLYTQLGDGRMLGISLDYLF
ncbi:TonB-dependent receptor [Bowmanella yangjiangensis]|uniref:TonB-dependent receptor n=1 Tax=Bowmanella yangjiangensis TaxID=2811230 RepID=A0ABS3CYD0_9ALTE|nr:TonB-dependent receptor [Bowmanella yangjiangensis]MBN7821396.1 TonB-dependent receptor [Bowmanella yangjiangensis]